MGKHSVLSSLMATWLLIDSASGFHIGLSQLATRPLRALSEQVALATTAASPFALAEVFSSDAFHQKQELVLTCVFDVETSIEEINSLVSSVEQGGLGASLRISTRNAKDGFRLVAAGPREALKTLIRLAAMRNLVPALSTWS